MSDPSPATPPERAPASASASEPASASVWAEWVESGRLVFEEAARGLRPADVAAPCALPGWSRGHLLTHVARNADALVNLLDWARTGLPTPMYASAGDRAEQIERGAARGPAEQLRDVAESSARFAAATDSLGEEHWARTVVSGRGRRIPAREVLWLRARELWVHLVDLDVGHGFAALPDGFGHALVQDVATGLDGRTGVRVTVHVPGGAPVTFGSGAPVEVRGDLDRVLPWMTGRPGPLPYGPAGGIPALPSWL